MLHTTNQYISMLPDAVQYSQDSLPDTVVKAEYVNSFKGKLDRLWNDQGVKYNWKADIKGSGSRSNV